MTASTKLASLIRLCFSAGIVFAAGAAMADCNLDHTICTQPGPGHTLPSICEQYPNDVQCQGGWGDPGSGEGGRPWDLSYALNALDQVPHGGGNSIQAGCSSSYAIRQASAKADVMAWWPTFIAPDTDYVPFRQFLVAVTYSSGQREAWLVDFNGFVNSASYREPGMTFEPVGFNPNPGYGYGVLGLAYMWDIHYDGGVWENNGLLCE